MKQTILQVAFITPSGVIISQMDKIHAEVEPDGFLTWIKEAEQEQKKVLGVETLGILSMNLIKFGYV
jgi:hypothetical protein